MTLSATLQIDVMTSMIAVVTVLTVVVIALVTLARPSRTTVTWGIAFGLAMLGTYIWFAGHQLEAPALRALASGMLLGFEPFIWLGLRMFNGRRQRMSLVVATATLFPVVLLVTVGTVAYQPAFHAVFLAAAVYAALIIRELSRLVPAQRDVVMPLALASGAFVVVAVVAACSALWRSGVSAETQLESVRGVNTVGTLVLSTCAAFTIVLLVRGGTAVAAGDRTAISARLARAQQQGDSAWSVLDIRLDDPVDLDEASTGADFAAIIERFHRDVLATLPVDADVDRVDDGQVFVAIRGSDEAIRHHLRALLNRVSTIEADASAFGIRVSASIGWASVATVGFDVSSLRDAADAAGRAARADGGDCWKRAGAIAAAHE